MKFDYNIEKNKLLKESRGINFEDVIKAVKSKRVIKDFNHYNFKKYPNQKLLIVEIDNYAYVVPYVIDKIRKVKFLKTVYADHDVTKEYLR